jgi:hypothetical protein
LALNFGLIYVRNFGDIVLSKTVSEITELSVEIIIAERKGRKASEQSDALALLSVYLLM